MYDGSLYFIINSSYRVKKLMVIWGWVDPLASSSIHLGTPSYSNDTTVNTSMLLQNTSISKRTNPYRSHLSVAPHYLCGRRTLKRVTPQNPPTRQKQPLQTVSTSKIHSEPHKTSTFRPRASIERERAPSTGFTQEWTELQAPPLIPFYISLTIANNK